MYMLKDKLIFNTHIYIFLYVRMYILHIYIWPYNQSITDDGVRDFIDKNFPLQKTDTWTQSTVPSVFRIMYVTCMCLCVNTTAASCSCPCPVVCA